MKNYDFIQIIEILYETLRRELQKQPEKLKQSIEIISKFSKRLCQGTRDIIHMEAMLINLNIVL